MDFSETRSIKSLYPHLSDEAVAEIGTVRSIYPDEFSWDKMTWKNMCQFSIKVNSRADCDVYEKPSSITSNYNLFFNISIF